MTISRFDAFAIVAAVAVVIVLLWLPAGAQVPPGGTVPPVSGIACLPDTHDISGCDDKVWLPYLAVTMADEAGRNVAMAPVTEVTE